MSFEPDVYKEEVEAQPAFFWKANDFFFLWNETFENRRFFQLFINGILHLLVISKFMTRLEPHFPQSTHTLTRGNAILWDLQPPIDPAKF